MFLKTAQHCKCQRILNLCGLLCVMSSTRYYAYLQQVTFSGVAFKHLAVAHFWSCQKTNWVVGGVHIYFLPFRARDGPLTYDQLLYVFSHGYRLHKFQ
jgi:hypothetical protein